MTWVRINATYFCCAAEINDDGIVIEAAPIIRWAMGKHYSKVLDFLRKKNALIDYEVYDEETQKDS